MAIDISELTTWEIKADMITPRNNPPSGVIGETIYTFGGQGNSGPSSFVFNESEPYYTTTNTWTSLTPMLHPRAFTNGVAVNGAVYIPGGTNIRGTGPLTTNDVFRP
ncbi:hypothetical protein F5884DRAFT_808329 [Xylogone sp. PMI_703]|nr:hypothetical protein F5884DRAFT_808329 [Xylogone sp. PMI_703]